MSSNWSGLSGNWEGTYNCYQGLTNLNLLIADNNPPDISAVFNFYANETNPNVPTGSFKMTGTYDSNTKEINLKGDKWIIQPSGFATSDLKGTVSDDNTQISGDVILEGCTTFTLKKR